MKTKKIKNNLTDRQVDDFNKLNGIEFNELDQKMFKVVGTRIDESEHLSSKPYSYWKSVGGLLLKSPTFMISLIFIIGIVIAMFVISPIGTDLVPLPEFRPGTGPANPSWQYPFGLGMRGEDFSKVIWTATRTTMLFALLVTVIQVLLGVVLGSIWGYFRKTDILFIQITTFLNLIPLMIFILFMLFVFNSRNFWVLILTISLQLWISIASVTRIQVLLVKNTDYNTASIFLGSNAGKIISKNIMPRILPVIVQQASLAIPAAIGLDATLSYLGFGYVNASDPTQASLGSVLSQILSTNTYQVYPHLLIFPVLMITLISVLFYLLGKVFSDSLDPKNHR